MDQRKLIQKAIRARVGSSDFDIVDKNTVMVRVQVYLQADNLDKFISNLQTAKAEVNNKTQDLKRRLEQAGFRTRVARDAPWFGILRHNMNVYSYINILGAQDKLDIARAVGL